MELGSQNPHQDLGKLIQKARGGDEIAFGQIYDIYFDKVYRFIYFRVNHKQTAEDLVSEVFTKVWNKMAEIREPSFFNSWIYQIARNLVVDHYRSRKFDVDLQTLENVLIYEENIIDIADLKLQQQEFIKALKNLTQEQQIVIKLKFLDELDNQEIAHILQKSEGAIRVIQHRAITELKKILTRDERI